MHWNFRKLAIAETNQNPAHVNFFRDDNEASEVGSFIREDIQNRLDACFSPSTGNPVRVRYRVFRNNEGLQWEERKSWMDSLRSHIESPQVEEELPNGTPPTDMPMDFLIAEDFETTGLRGDWNVNRDDEIDEQAEKNDFYWFVRNVGRSGKSGSDRGRWGLGKIVYPACSKIRSFFAYSVRSPDTKAFLIGRAVLPIHQNKEGKWVDSEGYFGNFDENSFCTPVSDIEQITRFADTFRLSRKIDEKGTSLVIPFVVDTITPSSIAESVIHSYFWELVQGNLIVEIEQAESLLEISKETLQECIETMHSDTFNSEKMSALCSFASICESFDYSGDNFFELKTDDSLNWKEKASWIEEDKLLEAQSAFSEGQPLCFEISVGIKPKGQKLSKSYFHVYLQSNPDLNQAEEHYIRDGLTITGQKTLRARGVRSLVIAEERALANLLGDAENPSHTRWIGTYVSGKYSYGPQIVSFVKNASTQIVNLLTNTDQERDADLLATVFGLPIDSPPKPQRRGRPKKKVVPPRPEPKVFDSPFYSVNKFQTGFEITKSAKDKKQETRDFTSLAISVKCAYEGSNQPIKDHSPFDFDLQNPMDVGLEKHDCEVEFISANEIKVYPENADFSVSLSGFDINRDLVVKTNKIVLDSDKEGEDS